MTTRTLPPNKERCQFFWKNGNQCRESRDADAGHGFCRYHFDRIERELRPPAESPWPEWLADEILPDGASLDSAASVNAVLTRLLRVALQGRIPVRHAGSIGYLVQHVLATLPGMKAEAANAPKHPLLGADPDATLLEIASALRRAVPPASASAPEPSLAPEPATEAQAVPFVVAISSPAPSPSEVAPVTAVPSANGVPASVTGDPSVPSAAAASAGENAP
jgi:hypothetical protein